MKFSEVNKSTTVNRFVLHTLQRNITNLALKTRKINKKFVVLKGGTGKEPIHFLNTSKCPKVKKMNLQTNITASKYSGRNKLDFACRFLVLKTLCLKVWV